MAGVVFVLKFLEIFLEFPHEDLGFGEDAGLEVGADDASLTFGSGGAVGLASVLTKSKGQPGRDCPFDNYCSRRTLPRTGAKAVSY